MGQNCQLGLRDNSGAGQWWEVSPGDVKAAPRTASAGVYLASTGAMYMFGGKMEVFQIAFPITDRLLIIYHDLECGQLFYMFSCMKTHLYLCDKNMKLNMF